MYYSAWLSCKHVYETDNNNDNNNNNVIIITTIIIMIKINTNT
jgi:hypothetical protein